MIIEVITKIDKETGERTLYSAHLSNQIAVDYLRSSGFPIVESLDPDFDFETSEFYFELEEVYLFN